MRATFRAGSAVLLKTGSKTATSPKGMLLLTTSKKPLSLVSISSKPRMRILSLGCRAESICPVRMSFSKPKVVCPSAAMVSKERMNSPIPAEGSRIRLGTMPASRKEAAISRTTGAGV